MAVPTKRVLIAGAGPTGLMAALWLNRLGTPFRIVDKYPYAADTSRAAVVQARTLEFYRMLGLSDKAISDGHIMKHLAFFNNQQETVRRAYGDIGKGKSKFPFVLMYPQDLNEKMMGDELRSRGVEIEREVEVTKLVQDPAKDFVDVTLKKKDGSEEVSQAAYVLGCDGSHSAVRENTDIKFSADAYSQRFFVADVEGEGQIGLDGVNICFNAEDFCILFPMKHGKMRLAGWAPDEAVAKKFTFADVEESVKRNTKANITKVNWFSTYTVRHGVANKFRDGRVFICGDAAHVHSPIGGQGMNTGLGDAVNISWKLAAVLSNKLSPTVLDTYESERLPFAQSLVGTTDRAFGLATAKSMMGRAYRTIVLGYIGPTLFRLGLIDSTIFETISQIRINYRGSSISKQNSIAGLYAGDRLPYVEFDDGTDNFEVLNTINWQIHVYGASNAHLQSWAQENDIQFHQFPFNNDAKSKMISEGSMLLIRPDGYIGRLYSGSDPANLSMLKNFLLQWDVKAF